MTPDEQNRAIAERLGKTYPCHEGEHTWKLQPAPRINVPCPAGYKCEKCWAFRWEGSANIELHDEAPATDYTSDLNAMHEAEKKLIVGPTDQMVYFHCLSNVCADTKIWHATAAQRAESLLKYIRLERR